MAVPVSADRRRDLREACVRQALAVIGESGVEALSLRDVARRLGVSHQAPYKHFPSRDHLLAEIVRRAFADFARHLDERPSAAEPHDDLAGMGRAYLSYARAHPLHYRLMFGTPLPDPQDHPDMMRAAQHAFALLRDCIARMSPDTATDGRAELDAMFVWSTMHGLASILQTPVVDTLGLGDDLLDASTPHVMARIGHALAAGHRPGTPGQT